MNVADQIKVLDHKAELEFRKGIQPVPIVTFANLQNEPKPILHKDLMKQVHAGVSSVKNADTWKEWGFRTSNVVLLLSGPPGTGKTITAKYLARLLKCSFISVGAADIGSGDFGTSERNLQNIYRVAKENKALVFWDECDALLWDREKATGDSMWMLGIINAILVAIEAYDGVTALASNHSHILDKALKRRISFEIKFTVPDYETRKKIWIMKWPTWPLKINEKEIETLALPRITGAEIESVLKEEARYAIEGDRDPTYKNIRRILEGIDAPEDQS